MNVKIGTEAAQFPEKEYINGISVAVRCVCCGPEAGRYEIQAQLRMALKNLNIITTVTWRWTFLHRWGEQTRWLLFRGFFCHPPVFSPDFCHIFSRFFCKLYVDFIVYSRCYQLIKLSKSKSAILAVLKKLWFFRFCDIFVPANIFPVVFGKIKLKNSS
jgi:hypothetical protein